MTQFEKKYFLISILNLGLQILLLWPRKKNVWKHRDFRPIGLSRFGNDTRYGHSYNRRLMGTRKQSIECRVKCLDILQRQITRKWYKIELYLQWQTNRKRHGGGEGSRSIGITDLVVTRSVWIIAELLIICYRNFRHSTYLHLATSEMWCWSGGKGILIKTVSVLQYCVLLIVMVHKDMSSSYRSVDCIRLWSCLV